MITLNPRITIFTGHFGSGKTELAINYAMKLAASGQKVTIVDWDIVNTYFRTKDALRPLTEAGIRVIAPEFANTNLDMPTLPPDVLGAFEDRESAIVFDVGGDKDGAYAIGGYKRFFDREPYEMLFVINARRPLTEKAEDMVEYLSEIEEASRLKVTGLVNNTNLSGDTDLDVLLGGQAEIDRAAQMTGRPVKYISGKPEIVRVLPEPFKQKAFGLDLYLQLPFLAE